MLIANDVLRWSADALLAGATLGCLYLVAASFLTFRFRARGGRGETVPVPVSILVPLCGHEPGLQQRLTALCDQDYGATGADRLRDK